MRVLGIESSCDDTGIALYDSTERRLLAHKRYTQIDCHRPYGGVVPELASRDHLRCMIPLLEAVRAEAALDEASPIEAIAYTAGPGLMGALLVGACFAKALAYAWQIPSIGIHHLEGHLLAPFLEDPAPTFPFLALLVSGGHTLLVRVQALGDYHILGETLDDAAGEAFDKTAKLLGLPYPGGAALAALATQGVPGRFVFPKPLTRKAGLDFSFSGLKTAVLNTWHKTAQSEQDKADIACAFQEAVVQTLVIKIKRALSEHPLPRLVIAGGVGANQLLRQTVAQQAAAWGIELYYPRIDFCTDNGAMIAYAGAARLEAFQAPDPDLAVRVYPRWPIDRLQNPCHT